MDEITIPKWQMKLVQDTLRRVTNAMQSSERGTSLDRDIMQSYNITTNALNGNTNLPTHRLTIGQVPELKEN